MEEPECLPGEQGVCEWYPKAPPADRGHPGPFPLGQQTRSTPAVLLFLCEVSHPHQPGSSPEGVVQKWPQLPLLSPGPSSLKYDKCPQGAPPQQKLQVGGVLRGSPL